MVKIEFLGPIGKKPMMLEINNLIELGDILKKDFSLDEWIENSAIAVNDVLIQDKTLKLNDGDKVSLLPPVCGG